VASLLQVAARRKMAAEMRPFTEEDEKCDVKENHVTLTAAQYRTLCAGFVVRTEETSDKSSACGDGLPPLKRARAPRQRKDALTQLEFESNDSDSDVMSTLIQGGTKGQTRKSARDDVGKTLSLPAPK